MRTGKRVRIPLNVDNWAKALRPRLPKNSFQNGCQYITGHTQQQGKGSGQVLFIKKVHKKAQNKKRYKPNTIAK